MENKKISFGFSKVSKKTEIVSKTLKTERKIELIDCLEDQSIKIKDAFEEKNEPLVIPMQGSSNKIVDEAKKAKEKRIKSEIKLEENGDTKPDSDLSIDELAARELIREAQNRNTVKNESKVFSLPLNEDKFVAEGADEPSLDDYDNVPISDYGMAMLRGMNWKEGMPIGKRTKVMEAFKVPELRPKGLGLGANKMVNTNKPDKHVDKDGKELQLVKGAFAKIIAGNHRGQYCEVQGFDDENCRVIVRTSLSKEILNLNEFLVVPVTKEEFTKGSRVINNAKYEEYKDKSLNNHNVELSSNSERSPSRSRKKDKKKKSKKHKHKYEVDSEDDKRRRRKHKKDRSKTRNSSSSDSERESRRRRSRSRERNRK